MSKRIKLLIRSSILIMIFMFQANALYAQDDSAYVTKADTVLSLFKTEGFHSPNKATFYSAILPGLGQAYNKKYWKIPILYAGIGGVIYGITFNTKYYNKYKTAYRDFIIRDPANTSYVEFANRAGLTREQVETIYQSWFKNALKSKKDYYKRNRDLSYIGLLAVYVLNMIDASVDANFYDFDISDDLSLRVEPRAINVGTASARPDGFGLQLQLRF